MNESRGAKYGRNLALLVVYVITSIDECEREIYREKFLEELRAYSLEPRKKGEPKNSGCTHELASLQTIRLNDPEHLAKLIKEGLHLMYQKGTAKRVLSSLLDNL